MAQMVKNLPVMQETQVPSLGWEHPPEKGWLLLTPVFLPGEFHGQRSLVGYRPCGCRVKHDQAINTFTFHYHHQIQSLGKLKQEPRIKSPSMVF